MALADDFAFAALDFLNITDNLVVHTALRRDEDYGHLLVDEGNGTVFHFGGGISLCVQIADFL